jgi:signal transduction histidine kinase
MHSKGSAARAARENRQPQADALAHLAPHWPRIRAVWRKLLALGEPCGTHAAALFRLLHPQRAGDSNSGHRAYQEACEHQGWELAQLGVPPECAAAAVALYVESALSYLESGDSKTARHIRGLTRWARAYQYSLLSGYRRHDDASRQTLEGRVALAERRCQDVAVELGDAYEKERRRLAQDLHDEIGHDLIVLKLYTQIIAMDLNKGDIAQVRRKLKESVSLIAHALKGVRHLTFDLGPAVWNEQGFLPAVRLYARQYATRTGLNVRFRSTGLKVNLPPRYESALYKALQGALSNVAAHAGAQNVKISLASRHNLAVMTVEDDGRGFNVGRKLRTPASSYGLRAMQDRIELLGGTIHFSSRPGRSANRGTVVEFHLPLHEVERA